MPRNLRRVEESVVKVCSAGSAFFAASMLILIITVIALYAIPSLTPYFLLTPESATPHIGMGIANAIVGSFVIASLATILATPLAIGTAIYLQRYAKDSAITRTARFFIEVLAGTPSVVIGIFGLLVLVYYLKPFTGGFSLIAGSIALAILIVPVIERSIEEAIITVPKETEEGSYALGADKWQTIRGVTLPIALPGLITGIIFGFGRAAEESAVVILTAGYSQFMPEFTVKANENLIGGIKVYPFQDVIGTLPYSVYHTYENSNVVKISNGFAAAFVLVCIVLCVNLSAKIILSRTLAGNNSKSGQTWQKFKILIQRTLIHSDNKNSQRLMKSTTGSSLQANQLDKFAQISLAQSDSDKLRTADESYKKRSFAERIRSLFFREKTPDPPHTRDPARISFKQQSLGLMNRIRQILPKRRVISDPAPIPQQPEVENGPGKTPSAARSVMSTGRAFLIGVTPFALFALALVMISLVVPDLSTGSLPVSGLILTVIITAITGIICTVVALLLRRRIFMQIRKKKRILLNRKGAGLACIAGIGIVFACSFIFSAHALMPDDGASGEAESGLFALTKNPLSIFGLGKGEDTTAQKPLNRTEQLAALLAAEENGGDEESTTSSVPANPVIEPIATAQEPAPGSAAASLVPVKDSLSLREPFQYGNANRLCTATVYNKTTLPTYFWWLIDYNRFVQETPPPGSTFLVVYLRIENWGNKSAVIPSADAIVVTHNGETYTHQPYFNKTYLSDWQTEYYSTNLDKLPYQWIREIGAMKRDYGYLTGYNVFGQNTTRIDSTSDVPDPDFDINGKGFFLQPGRSNAIDGYLIFIVPDAVAADLRNTYVQATFNSISTTRWRLSSW